MLAPTPRWAAVLGSPIGHSLSPVLHRAAYEALGLPWTYAARSVRSGELSEVFALARADQSFAGFSLTMPLKAEAVPLLDTLDTLSTSLGVVNTVIPTQAGLAGHNTDVAGITAALERVGAAQGPALVLGAGGTARAAVQALQLVGREVTVACRRSSAAQGWNVRLVPFRAAVPGDFPLVVSTTPAGATDELAASGWPAATALVEVLYAPWPTPLAAAAMIAGAKVAGGLVVLLGQAVAQVTLMTGMRAPVAAMTAALEFLGNVAETSEENHPAP